MTLSLVDQRSRLKAKIATCQGQLRVVEKKIGNQRRQLLVRLKVLVGQIATEEIYRVPSLREEMYDQLNSALTRKQDRAVFEARYPRGEDERISTPDQQRQQRTEIAKLDWRLSLLVGAELMNWMPMDPKIRPFLRGKIKERITNKRERAKLLEMLDEVTVPKQ